MIDEEPPEFFISLIVYVFRECLINYVISTSFTRSPCVRADRTDGDGLCKGCNRCPTRRLIKPIF